MIDVKHWNWTGPTIDPKTKKPRMLETADLVKAVAAKAGVEGELYFGTDEYGEYIGFRAESGKKDSATTPNTDYPRSEFRQTTESGEDKEANWKASQKKYRGMRAKARIISQGKSKKAIVGQVHGDGDHPALKIQITGDTAYAQLRPKLNGPEVDPDPTLGKIEVGGAPFTYDYRIYQDYTADVWFNGKLAVEKFQFDAKSYKNDTWYNKAGMYSQENAKTGSGVGDIRFYELEMYDSDSEQVEQPTPEPTTPPVTPKPTPTAPTPAPATGLAGQIQAIVDKNKAGTLKAQAAKDELNDLGDKVDAMPDGAEQNALYKQLKAAVTGLK